MESRIKAGCGYWDTTNYPYGGKFCRAGSGGQLLSSVGEPYSRYNDGTVKEYKCTIDNKRVVVVRADFIEEN